MTLLTQNSDLRRTGIWNWTLPALSARLDDRLVVTCPQAGVCAKLCYARNGTYLFPAVRGAHERNLRMVVEDLPGWTRRMTAECRTRSRYRRWVRIHDSGDFFSADYALAWCKVAYLCPNSTFYAYTKEVTLFKSEPVRSAVPTNLHILYSTGGREDHLIDRDVDRHADVFPTLDALEAAGYSDQGADDRLAITLPTNRIGIVANNIAHYRTTQGDASFGELQAGRDARRAPVG